MSNSLEGLRALSTFPRLLQVAEADGLDGTPRIVRDGAGDASPLLLSTSLVEVNVAPTTPASVTTKSYVDAALSGLATSDNPSFTGTLTVSDPAAWRTALGATVTGVSLFTAVDAAAARTAAGITATGSTIVTQSSMVNVRNHLDVAQRPTAARWTAFFVASSTAYTLPSLAAQWAWVLFVFNSGVPASVLSGVQAGGGSPIITTTATQTAMGFMYQVNT